MKHALFIAAFATLMACSCSNSKTGSSDSLPTEPEEPAYVSQYSAQIADSLCCMQDPYPDSYFLMVEQINHAMDDAEAEGNVEIWVKKNIAEARNAQYLARSVKLSIKDSEFPADLKEPADKTLARFDSIKGLTPIYEFNLDKVYDGTMQPNDYIDFANKVGVPVDSLEVERLTKAAAAGGFYDDYEY